MNISYQVYHMVIQMWKTQVKMLQKCFKEKHWTLDSRDSNVKSKEHKKIEVHNKFLGHAFSQY
jgi:hypothetical protein